MTTRKSSLKFDRTQDLIDLNINNLGLPKQRKNSLGITRLTLEEINTNYNITLDEKFTNRLVFVKRLEKLEKDAIRLFYDQKTTECFENLEKCISILEEKQMKNFGIQDSSEDSNTFPEHLVYVRYLQCEFYFKTKEFSLSREAYEKINKIAPKINRDLSKKNEKEKVKEYFGSLEVLNACLLFEEGRYTEAIKCVEEIELKMSENSLKLSEKSVKQALICRIQSLMEICVFKTAIKLIEKFTSAYESTSMKEKWRVYSLLALAHYRIQDTEKSEIIMENLIEVMKNEGSLTDNRCKSVNEDGIHENKSYLSKSYSSYVEIFREEPLKAIVIAKKWSRECSSSDHAFVKLFHLFHQIGDYEQALQEFSQISCSYKRTSEDWEYLAEIKEFYGENESSEHMYRRAFELCKKEEKRMMIELKLLQFTKQETRKDAMKIFERHIKENRYQHWINNIVDDYGEYLHTIGEQDRFARINQIIAKENCGNLRGNSCELLKTAKFGSVGLNKEEETGIKKRKRNSLMIQKLL